MRILLIGSGGREAALARALMNDSQVSEVFLAPGNDAMVGTAVGRGADITDPAQMVALAVNLGIDLVVVGPEAPLVAGVADAIAEAGVAVFGPSAAAAQLEGSKAFAKEVMAQAQVPTAASVVCENEAEVEAALRRFGPPYVVKDDGLAGGKGVVVTEDFTQAAQHGRFCVERPGGRVVIEEFLDGPEVSLFCICDGFTVVPLQPAQDFKRVGEGGTGSNTGGMGAYSPLLWAPEGLVDEVVRTVAQPTVDEMARRGAPFVGVLYCGLALTSKGVRVVEFNARFGDPETQVVLPRLKTPLGGLLMAAARGALRNFGSLEWADSSAVTVVLAAGGYPGTPRLGDVIGGLQAAEAVPGVHVIHAGSKRNSEGDFVSSGGRVLCVVGEGDSVAVARERAYAGMAEISLAGSHFRRDIAAGL